MIFAVAVLLLVPESDFAGRIVLIIELREDRRAWVEIRNLLQALVTGVSIIAKISHLTIRIIYRRQARVAFRRSRYVIDVVVSPSSKHISFGSDSAYGIISQAVRVAPTIH